MSYSVNWRRACSRHGTIHAHVHMRSQHRLLTAQHAHAHPHTHTLVHWRHSMYTAPSCIARQAYVAEATRRCCQGSRVLNAHSAHTAYYILHAPLHVCITMCACAWQPNAFPRDNNALQARPWRPWALTGAWTACCSRLMPAMAIIVMHSTSAASPLSPLTGKCQKGDT